MKVKIINTDSEHSKHRIGQERYISFINNRMVMEYTDDSGKQATTSRVEKVIVKTRNSTYEMEVVNDNSKSR